ncbi:MAG TPA: hypothetical protein VGI81_20535 [Tepidisphaeraceae bacterium]|jgi:hypothetical protein
MIRRLLTAASMLSLALCMLAAVLWVRSYWVHESIDRWHPDNGWIVSSNRSTIFFLWWTEHSAHDDSGWSWVRNPPSRDGDEAFGLVSNQQPYVSDDGSVVWRNVQWVWFPHWIAFAATCCLPAMAVLGSLHRTFRRRRRRRQFCLSCGYDLRASTARCPECGTPIPAKS